jgi:uncharacterized membrane protein YtjA (UPF0391 family)
MSGTSLSAPCEIGEDALGRSIPGINAEPAVAAGSYTAGQNCLGRTMLKWALIFFIVALVAGALGFTDIAAGAASIAKVLFAIFLIVFLVLLVIGIRAGQTIF